MTVYELIQVLQAIPNQQKETQVRVLFKDGCTHALSISNVALTNVDFNGKLKECAIIFAKTSKTLKESVATV